MVVRNSDIVKVLIGMGVVKEVGKPTTTSNKAVVKLGIDLVNCKLRTVIEMEWLEGLVIFAARN